MEKQTIRIRRVGSFTFGLVMIAVGILFLLELFFPLINSMVVLQFWPVIFISLGVEILIGCRSKTWEVTDSTGNVIEQSRMVYDIPAILMTVVLTGFSFCLAILHYICVNGPIHWTF